MNPTVYLQHVLIDLRKICVTNISLSLKHINIYICAYVCIYAVTYASCAISFVINQITPG